MHRQTYSHNGLKRVIYDEKQITPEFTANVQAAWPGYSAVIQQVATSNPPALRTPTCPTLVIWGEHDRLSSPEDGRRMAAEINGAKVQAHSERRPSTADRAARRVSEYRAALPAWLAMKHPFAA